MTILPNKKNPLQVVLDESVIYLEESFGSVLIRGEVIVNFEKPTPIQGPIEILFEGIQRFYPWSEIMILRPMGNTIETVLQSIELSLLPPNTNGIMPPGVHRFPFEFPISAALPPTVSIPERIDIFYQLSATLRRSNASRDQSGAQQLLDWARLSVNKKNLVTTKHIRLIRALEYKPLVPHTIPSEVQEDVNSTDQLAIGSSIDPQERENQEGSTPLIDPWNQFNLTHRHVTSLDEQIDRLAFSLAGRSIDNYHRSPFEANKEQGIRFRISVDRTVIALGTSIGLDVHVEPTLFPAKIKSIVLTITETRKYRMKVPSNHSHGFPAETRKATEIRRMLLKWAYCYPSKGQATENNHFDGKQSSNDTGAKGYLGDKFNQKVVSIFSDQPSNTSFSQNPSSDKHSFSSSGFSGLSNERIDYYGNPDCSEEDSSSPTKPKLVNLKEIDHPVNVGEAFAGRFEMVVPSCSNAVLNPSMEDESIQINHWLNFSVVMECDGQPVELNLESQVRMLNCRLVAADDDRQMILPPPPSYNCSGSFESSRHSNSFWEQRQPITRNALWGTCNQCPCKIKSTAASKPDIKTKKSKSAPLSKTSDPVIQGWGPPPCYSDNN
ncbi:hypothetical protein F4703DRAFT_1790761 [Phycomyces blakesleeanus]